MNGWKKIAVTNRHLCRGSLLEQIERIAAGADKPDALILREKDLSGAAYQELAGAVLECCRKYQIDCVLHTYFETAQRLDCSRIHLPLAVLSKHQELAGEFRTLGVSVHSADEAVLAQSYGADYVTVGHIFATDCKKGLPPRGMEFLKQVCEAVEIPVYAIGGMDFERFSEAVRQGAAGICVMSGYMSI